MTENFESCSSCLDKAFIRIAVVYRLQLDTSFNKGSVEIYYLDVNQNFQA